MSILLVRLFLFVSAIFNRNMEDFPLSSCVLLRNEGKPGSSRGATESDRRWGSGRLYDQHWRSVRGRSRAELRLLLLSQRRATRRGSAHAPFGPLLVREPPACTVQEREHRRHSRLVRVYSVYSVGDKWRDLPLFSAFRNERKMSQAAFALVHHPIPPRG